MLGLVFNRTKGVKDISLLALKHRFVSEINAKLFD